MSSDSYGIFIWYFPSFPVKLFLPGIYNHGLSFMHQRPKGEKNKQK